MCKPLRSCYSHFYLPKRETDPLPWWVPTPEPKREVLPQPLTLLRFHICDQESRDCLTTTIVAVWELLISPTGVSPMLPLVRIIKKTWFKQQSGAVRNSCGKLLWENLVGKSCGKFLQEIVVGKFCRKILWEIPHTYLQTISEGNFQNMQFI